MTLRQIRIESSGVTVQAELNDSATADALWEALPLNARAQTWGDEIYFSIPVSADEDDAQATVEMGAVGLLASRKCALSVFRADSDEPGRRDQTGKPSQRTRNDRRSPKGP